MANKSEKYTPPPKPTWHTIRPAREWYRVNPCDLCGYGGQFHAPDCVVADIGYSEPVRWVSRERRAG